MVIEGVAYSVPFRLIGKTVDVHRTASLVSIVHNATRVELKAKSLRKTRADAIAPQEILAVLDNQRTGDAVRMSPRASGEQARRDREDGGSQP